MESIKLKRIGLSALLFLIGHFVWGQSAQLLQPYDGIWQAKGIRGFSYIKIENKVVNRNQVWVTFGRTKDNGNIVIYKKVKAEIGLYFLSAKFTYKSHKYAVKLKRTARRSSLLVEEEKSRLSGEGTTIKKTYKLKPKKQAEMGGLSIESPPGAIPKPKND
ncbi:MAG: hypothetical protein AAFY71_10915 [Bacteroidota bacterium]